MTPTIPTEPSMADIRAFMAPTTAAPVKDPEPEPETPETPAEPAGEEYHEAAKGTAETKPEPEEKQEELPEGVRKRIAKEAEKAARIQSEIDRAVSERKAKEAELEKLKTTGEKGSEPVKTPQSTSAEPKEPTFGEAGHENEDWTGYTQRQTAYKAEYVKWIKAETSREFEQNWEARMSKARADERMAAAVKAHGATFPSKVEAVQAVAPPELQAAIGSLDGWDKLAVHLADNPAKLKELVASFQQNPVRAIATLGRIEAAITATPATKSAPDLPEPIKRVGGSASVSSASLQETFQSGSVSAAKAAFEKMRGSSKR